MWTFLLGDLTSSPAGMAVAIQPSSSRRDGHGITSPIIQGVGEKKNKRHEDQDFHLPFLQTNVFFFTAAERINLAFTCFDYR